MCATERGPEAHGRAPIWFEAYCVLHLMVIRSRMLVDACLVRLAELHDGASVLTIDQDFAAYRKHGRRAIPLIAPGG